MKRLFCFLLCSFLFVSASFGADRCSASDKTYDADKRCYVSKELFTKTPYNAAAHLLFSPMIQDYYCSGVIVKEKGKLYLYTVKHCVDENNGDYRKNVYVKLPGNGKVITARKYQIYPSEDFAIYSIDDDVDMPFVELSQKFYGDDIFYEDEQKVRVIGYGTLKIMTDEEIEEVRQKYVFFLQNKKGRIVPNDYAKEGFAIQIEDDKHYNSAREFLKYLVNNENDYYESVFQDHALKVSECTYTQVDGFSGCQVWGANSGSGLYDEDNKVEGFVATGTQIIGGKYHAGLVGTVSTEPKEEDKGFELIKQLVFDKK